MDEHPLFARFLQLSAEIGERKGAAEHRRALLAGLRGRVVEVGAGSGVMFWPRLFGGRDTVAAIRAAGFDVVALRSFTFAPTPWERPRRSASRSARARAPRRRSRPAA